MRDSSQRRIRSQRRIAKAVVGVVALWSAVLVATPAAAQSSGPASLADRLKFGLQARRPVELAFVTAVVDTVSRGELPVRIVDRTFFWARERAPRQDGRFTRRPIIYFQPALQIQADRLGITIRPN